MSLPKSPQSLSASSHPPQDHLVCSLLRPWPWLRLMCPVLSSRARACRRDHQAPSAPLPDVGVTSARETCTVSCEDITPRSSLLRAHVPIPSGSPLLRFFASFEESLQVATSPCCQQDLLDVILRVFPWLPGPLPRRSHRVHAPVTSPMSSAFPKKGWVGFPLLSTNATFRGSDFEAADIPLCSGPQVCSPSRLHPPLRLCRRAAKAFTSGQNVLRCLRTHRIC
jgi:hypothetical protein